MIRPFTCLVFLLACGSGLYLYQSKHRARCSIEQIAQTVKSTEALREQTRMLSAEWTLLNDPERLRQLASQFLTLQTVSPNQFTSLADLDSRLPRAARAGGVGQRGGRGIVRTDASGLPMAPAGREWTKASRRMHRRHARADDRGTAARFAEGCLIARRAEGSLAAGIAR